MQVSGKPVNSAMGGGGGGYFLELLRFCLICRERRFQWFFQSNNRADGELPPSWKYSCLAQCTGFMLAVRDARVWIESVHGETAIHLNEIAEDSQHDCGSGCRPWNFEWTRRQDALAGRCESAVDGREPKHQIRLRHPSPSTLQSPILIAALYSSAISFGRIAVPPCSIQIHPPALPPLCSPHNLSLAICFPIGIDSGYRGNHHKMSGACPARCAIMILNERVDSTCTRRRIMASDMLEPVQLYG